MPTMPAFAGILAQLAEKGDAYRRRDFTAKDIMRIADQAAQQGQRECLNLYSCYELDGDYGLRQTIGRFCAINHPADQKITAAIESGNEQALFEAFLFAMRFAFVTLYQRNALKRIQLVDKWPEEARREYTWIHDAVKAATASTSTPAALPAVVPVETPVETCAREFKELTGDKFKAKYMNDRRLRPIFDAAVAAGRV